MAVKAAALADSASRSFRSRDKQQVWNRGAPIEAVKYGTDLRLD